MVGISAVKEDLETLSVKVHLSGLAVGTKYDVFRLQLRYLGKDSNGTRLYERELPDRLALWSGVAHRVNWAAPAAAVSFRDHEAPKRPIQYFIVPTASQSPHEFDYTAGNYPLGRGVLSPEIVHFNQDLRDILGADVDEGHILIRSTHELAHFADTCLVEIDVGYTARVNEFAVMGNPYPAVVADSREGRRGQVTVLTRNLGQYNALRRIVFPASGRIRPLLLQSGGDAATLLDDMRVVPLDVEVTQATPAKADWRFIRIEYVESDPSAPLVSRSGDRDVLDGATPEAAFTISDTTPNPGQWVTLTSTSSGSISDYEWTVDDAKDNAVGKFYTAGPHRVRFDRGRRSIKLRVGGPTAGYHTRTRFVDVG